MRQGAQILDWFQKIFWFCVFSIRSFKFLVGAWFPFDEGQLIQYHIIYHVFQIENCFWQFLKVLSIFVWHKSIWTCLRILEKLENCFINVDSNVLKPTFDIVYPSKWMSNGRRYQSFNFSFTLLFFHSYFFCQTSFPFPVYSVFTKYAFSSFTILLYKKRRRLRRVPEAFSFSCHIQKVCLSACCQSCLTIFWFLRTVYECICFYFFNVRNAYSYTESHNKTHLA